MNDYEDKEILTKQERFVNLLYYIFRYILYSCGFYTFKNVFGEFLVLILMGAFIFLSMSYDAAKKKIQEEIILRERRDAFKKAKEIDNEDEMDIF